MRHLRVLAGLVVLVLGIAGLGWAAPSLDAPYARPPKPAKAYRLGVLITQLANPHFIGMAYGIQDEAHALGASTILHDAGGYQFLDRQISQMEDLIANRVDAILLVAVSGPGTVPVVEKAYAARIPVININVMTDSPHVAIRIRSDDKFLGRVVPAILQSSPQIKASPDDLLPSFLKINNDVRRMNNDTISALAKKTAPGMLWEGAFQPLGGSQIESAFADFRTYLYDGKDVDRQVHLGFDLAKTANSPVTAGNNGKVVFASELGIYGNTVIVDHGMGVQSLYGHLSSFGVNEGDTVKKGQQLGASGQTGLAGGDHLHFSMLVNGQFVNATEWWDPHWIEDRIMRKLREAGARVPDTAPERR